MVKHIILWQLKDELTAEDKAAVKAEAKLKLEALLGQIDGLTEIHVYTEAMPTSNADMMLDTTFASAQALNGYAVAPAHVAIASGLIAPNIKQRVCMDFEI